MVHGLGIGHGSLDCDSVIIDPTGRARLVGMGANAEDPSVDLTDVGYCWGRWWRFPTLRSSPR